jgi:hypothetical protein
MLGKLTKAKYFFDFEKSRNDSPTDVEALMKHKVAKLSKTNEIDAFADMLDMRMDRYFTIDGADLHYRLDCPPPLLIRMMTPSKSLGESSSSGNILRAISLIAESTTQQASSGSDVEQGVQDVDLWSQPGLGLPLWAAVPQQSIPIEHRG